MTDWDRKEKVRFGGVEGDIVEVPSIRERVHDYQERMHYWQQQPGPDAQFMYEHYSRMLSWWTAKRLEE